MAPSPATPRGQWINGRELPSGVSGAPHPCPGGFRRHLRAGAHEAEAAELAAASGSAPGRGPGAAQSRAEALIEGLLADDTWLDEWALELGLPASALETELDLLEQLDLARLPELAAPAPQQCALFLAHWSLGMAGLLERVLPLWLAGWPMVVVGDGRLPGLVHRLGRAAAENLGPRLSALPDPDWAAVQAAPWRGALVLGRAASEAQVAGLRRRAELGGLSLPSEPGVLECYSAARTSISAQLEPALAARRWLGACLDAYPGFGGQSHGVPTWAEVPAQIYAQFCEAAFELLEGGYGQPLCPPIEADAVRRLRAAVQSGLEQGGVLISGPEGPAELVWRPALFVNCEAGAGVLQRREPLPVLCLSRC